MICPVCIKVHVTGGGMVCRDCADAISLSNFPLSHEACDAFWKYWKENGETHKHGYYESTWGAIRAYLDKAATTKDQRTH